jgi:hypothetical protein
MTYEPVGNELLFELVGLCHACYSIAHASGSHPIPVSMIVDGSFSKAPPSPD